MGKVREWMQRNKAMSFMCSFGFIVLINCCGFPLYNLNKEWPFMLTAVKFYLVLTSAWATGGILYSLFPKKNATFILMMATVLPSVGLICRYFLEFGEVSNTYNFTLPNIILHLGAFVALTFLSWIYVVKKSAANQ